MKSGIFQILVGIDFSMSSVGAMRHAMSLAERLDAVLHLCHITPLEGGLTAPIDLGLNIPSSLPCAQEARQLLERLRAMISPAISVDLHLRMGDPVRGMLDLAGELWPDMIVVGNHGFGPVLEMLMGSVATQLTRLSPVPVLVVPSPEREGSAHPDFDPAFLAKLLSK